MKAVRRETRQQPVQSAQLAGREDTLKFLAHCLWYAGHVCHWAQT